MKRVKRIEWNNVSLVVDVDVAIMSIVCSAFRALYREYSRLHHGSLASLAHLSGLASAWSLAACCIAPIMASTKPSGLKLVSSPFRCMCQRSVTVPWEAGI